MASEVKELNVRTVRALMSLIKLTEALEDDGCINVISGRKVSEMILPEVMAVAAAGARQKGCEEEDIRKTVAELVNMGDARKNEAFADGVLQRMVPAAADAGESEIYKVLKSFDESVTDKEADFYIKRGGSDADLSQMFVQTVKAVERLYCRKRYERITPAEDEYRRGYVR